MRKQKFYEDYLLTRSWLRKKDKNKYEVINGGLKSSDELVELYSDLIAKNPRINMIIEPFTASVSKSLFFKDWVE